MQIKYAADPWDVKDDECIKPAGPDPAVLREAALTARRQAVARIEQINREFAQRVAKATEALIEADRNLTAAKDVLRKAEAARLEASQLEHGLVHQRDNAIDQQERIIRGNPDLELRVLLSRLEGELWNVQQNDAGSRRAKSRIAKLENAIAKANNLERDHGIINMAKLELALASVAMSGGLG